MKVESTGKVVLFFGILCFFLSGSSLRLWAQQSYPSHVTIFGPSSQASAAPPPIDPAKQADIRRLMDTLEMKDLAAQLTTSMVNSMRPLLLHSLPPGAYRERLVQLFFQKFQAELDAQKLLDLAVPIYAQYLSDDDIKGLIRFYQTPLGQKWLQVRPKVQASLAPRARAWGQALGRQAMLDVIREHPDLARQLGAAVRAAHQR